MKQYFLFAAVALMLPACNNDESNVQSPDTIRLTATVEGSTTRATLTATQAQDTQFDDGQNIHVDVFETGGTTRYSSGTYRTTDADGTMSGTLKYPSGGEAVDIEAYYPSTVAYNTETFRVQTTQTTYGNYQASDLMYASVENKSKGSTHSLTFHHALTKIVVNLTADASIDDASLTKLTSVTINGTKTTANITKGAWTSAGGSVESIDITGTTKLGSHVGIIVPQTVAAGTTFITVVYNGKTLPYKIPAMPVTGKNFAPGNQYTYTFNITMSGISLKSEEMVTGWTPNTVPNEDLIL